MYLLSKRTSFCIAFNVTNRKMIKFIFTCVFAFCIFSVSSQELVSISKNDAIADIDFMINTVESVHYNPYELISKEDLYSKKDSIISIWGDAENIPLRLFLISASKISALYKGGNITVEWQNTKLFPELGAYGFLPFKLKNVNGKAFCSLSSTDEVKTGEEVLTINSIPTKTIFKDLDKYSGSITAYKDEYIENFFPLYLFLNGIKGPYFIEKANGEIGYVANGLSLVDASLLLTSHLPQELFSLKFQKNDVALLTLNSVSDVDTFQTFIQESFKTISEKGITNLIVDIRKNNSVNPTLNDILLPYVTKQRYRQSSGRFWKVSPQMKQRFQDSIYIDAFGQKFADKFIASENSTIIKDLDKKRMKPKKQEHLFEGVSCFLIGPNTFGSAADLADAIQIHKISTLIGQPTGELTNAYGELIEEIMPNSGTYFFIPSTYDLGSDGDADRRSPVIPDVEATKNIIDIAKNFLMSN